MGKVNFIASIKEESLSNTKEIAGQLKAMGYTIHDVFEELGTITGSTEKKSLITELKIDGIEAIEVQKNVKKYKSNK
jgi:hypothetical protein